MTLEEMIAKTGKRQSSFQLMIDFLDTVKDPLIIETGCAHPMNPIWGTEDVSFADDGWSTRIFDAYITRKGGEFHSIDIDPVHVDFAKSLVSENTQVHCSDSVEFLWNANESLTEEGNFIDLLYLDSYDFEFEGPNLYLSPAHHLKELTAIISRLRPGSMVAVDDNFIRNGRRVGKGMFVEEFMNSIGKPLVHDGHQLIWKF